MNDSYSRAYVVTDADIENVQACMNSARRAGHFKRSVSVRFVARLLRISKAKVGAILAEMQRRGLIVLVTLSTTVGLGSVWLLQWKLAANIARTVGKSLRSRMSDKDNSVASVASSAEKITVVCSIQSTSTTVQRVSLLSDVMPIELSVPTGCPRCGRRLQQVTGSSGKHWAECSVCRIVRRGEDHSLTVSSRRQWEYLHAHPEVGAVPVVQRVVLAVERQWKSVADVFGLGSCDPVTCCCSRCTGRRLGIVC